VICGFALAHLMPVATFYLLIGSVLLAALFYYLGARH